jgi:hypothetical protein
MDRLVEILEELGLPFAYDHFAEGESPEPPVYVLPAIGEPQFCRRWAGVP